MELIERIKNDLKENLTEYRYIHSLGVMEMAEELAKVYNVDVESARIAGLLHDIAKEMTKEESLEYVEKNNIAIDEVDRSFLQLSEMMQVFTDLRVWLLKKYNI